MSDPTPTPNAQVPAEPPSAWLAMCCHCGQGTEVPLPIDRDGLALQLARAGWFISVLTPPGQGPEVPIVLGALCSTCAPTIYPPEVLQVAEQRRQQLLAGQVP